MDPLTVQTIADYAGGRLLQGQGARFVTNVVTDTRKAGQGDLFVALRGDNFDGHRFVGQLPARGCVGAVVDKGLLDEQLSADFALIDVENPLLAFQNIAGAYRRSLPMKLVAITGSNGKTSTKDLTATLLKTRYRVLKTAGNFNNHVGVPQTLLQASGQDEIVVLEIGMNHPGEIAPLAVIARPDVAIITNIGTAHIEYMKTRGAIAQEKGVLAEAVGSGGHVVLCAEDEFTPAISRRTKANVLTVGFKEGDVRAEKLRPTDSGTEFSLVADGQRWDAFLPVSGKHMVANSLLAATAAHVHGVSWEECVSALATAQLTKGRLERKTAGGLNILDDSYNANPDSVVAAVETLAQLPTRGRRIAVLGKMGELGSESEAGHLRVGLSASREKLDQLLGVGTEGGIIASGAEFNGLTRVEVVSDVQMAADWLREFARPEDLILIKGSRSAGMERIIDLLAGQPSESAH